MVALFDSDLKMPDRRSSKGNQLKFERDGIWYKADYLGYEGLVEYSVSKLLGCSDLKKEEYVDYETDVIVYNGQEFNACRSCDFKGNWQLITLERLFQQSLGQSLNRMIYTISDHTQRLKLLVEQVERLTGIKRFGVYMCKILTIDALFLNEDRHSHNLAVLTDGNGAYRLSPIFDNGAGLLSDTSLEYPMDQDYLNLMERVRPKTFSDTFEKQLEVAEMLYGQTIRFNYGYNMVKEIVNKAEQYDAAVRTRIINVIMQTRRKYAYLFY